MDGTAITIVSVFVAGVIGPGITAWAAAQAQRRRFAHERELHDLDDLRRELDHLGDTFAELIHALVMFWAMLNRVERGQLAAA